MFMPGERTISPFRTLLDRVSSPSAMALLSGSLRFVSVKVDERPVETIVALVIAYGVLAWEVTLLPLARVAKTGRRDMVVGIY